MKLIKAKISSLFGQDSCSIWTIFMIIFHSWKSSIRVSDIEILIRKVLYSRTDINDDKGITTQILILSKELNGS